MSEAQPSVVLITVDCLRAQNMSCYGYSRNTTPFIDSLAAQGVLYSNAFANGPFTAAAFPAILSSTYALDNGKNISLQGRTFVGEIFQKEEIQTAGIHSNPYLSSQFGYNKGFDYFEDSFKRGYSKKSRSKMEILAGKINEEINDYLKKKKWISLLNAKSLIKNFIAQRKIPFSSAEEITKCATEWIKSISSPFFLWVHYMDLHEPYVIRNTGIPQIYSTSLSRLAQSRILRPKKQSRKNIINVYDDKLKYIDTQVQFLLKTINKEKKNTAVILTSDHGQEIFEHGDFGHRARYYEEILHIPLIVYGPMVKKGVVDSMHSQLDISPTLLSFFDISPPAQYRGSSLFSHSKKVIISESSHNENGVYTVDNISPDSFYMSYACRTKTWKYIKQYGIEELFNIENDPHEIKNVAGSHIDILRKFREILKNHNKNRKLTEKNRISESIGKLKIDKKL